MTIIIIRVAVEAGKIKWEINIVNEVVNVAFRIGNNFNIQIIVPKQTQTALTATRINTQAVLETNGTS